MWYGKLLTSTAITEKFHYKKIGRYNKNTLKKSKSQLHPNTQKQKLTASLFLCFSLMRLYLIGILHICRSTQTFYIYIYIYIYMYVCMYVIRPHYQELYSQLYSVILDRLTSCGPSGLQWQFKPQIEPTSAETKEKIRQ